MVRIRIVDVTGAPRTIEVAEGTSLMQAALAENVAGLDAVCGGSMSCATCAVRVRDPWLHKLAPQVDQEAQTLEFSGKAEPCARLSCQIMAIPELDGITVEVIA